MSYSLVGHFYINNKEALVAGIDRLKNLSEMRYSANFQHVDPIAKPEEIKTELQLTFYNYDSFAAAMAPYKKLNKKYSKKLKNLKKLKNSVEYYKLPAEACDNILQEIQDYSEMKEDLHYTIEAVKYILHVFEFMEDITFDGEYYHDQKNICVGIEVS